MPKISLVDVTTIQLYIQLMASILWEDANGEITVDDFEALRLFQQWGERRKSVCVMHNQVFIIQILPTIFRDKPLSTVR